MNIQPVFVKTSRRQIVDFTVSRLLSSICEFHFKSASKAMIDILNNFKKPTTNKSSTCAIISTPCLVIKHAWDTKRLFKSRHFLLTSETVLSDQWNIACPVRRSHQFCQHSIQLASWAFCGNLDENGSSSTTKEKRTCRVHHSHTSTFFTARVGCKLGDYVPQRRKPWRS